MFDPQILDLITNAQNLGTACPHCQSKTGHFSFCRTINGTVQEVYNLSQGDDIILHSLGVKWN